MEDWLKANPNLGRKVEITETKEQLFQLAFFDPLTNCFNRNMLEKLRRDFDETRLSVIMIDIDNLKKCNTKYGHVGGDKRINDVARFLDSKFYYTFRLGGDEFLCIDILGSEVYIDEILERCEGVSYGIYIKSATETLHDAMHKADLKMYEHKNTKKTAAKKPWKVIIIDEHVFLDRQAKATEAIIRDLIKRYGE